MIGNKDILLDQAEYRLCENRDERPSGTQIDLLVIHSISLPPGEFGGPWIDDFFMNRLDPDAHPYFREIHQLKVSCHLLIRRDGRLIQYVPLNQRAWHAGISNYCGREQCNDFSIGIELEGADGQPFTEEQYRTLTRATRAIITHFPAIDQSRITSHAAISPGRKTDPGPLFDWSKYLASLNSNLA
ncbi:MAG: 1,6-anhydro-N-acetylmuramyl-L-alanine amidase AmpD [Candidatus Thiodiazotropha sp. (ex Monitilora ramsayi)]|nr:1,6-anhydro-N-acetylmuramyl-L-alanine amidase AmpD [Candidatus Thiodiazotropha sp. (ex Monitilora ramsayi)]